MGFLDLPAPLFALLERALGFLPGIARLGIWALLSAAGAMWLYRRFSRQEELAELKPEIKAAQRRMARYDGPLAGLWPQIGESMRLSGRQMALTLWPALVASLPVLFVLVFLSNHYGHRFPAPGAPVQVTPAEAESPPGEWHWRGDTDASWQAGAGQWRVPWPENAAMLLAPDYGVVLTLPPEAPVTVVHRRRWWNLLLANPAGYLPDAAPVDAVRLGLPRQSFVAFGPDWLGYWEAPYLALLVAFSVLIKVGFRIH